MEVEQLELMVHPFSSYSLYVLYVKEFKGIDVTVQHLSLTQKPSWFRKISFSKLVPLLNISRQNRTVTLNDSKAIVQYFESFPGPSLYPKNAQG